MEFWATESTWQKYYGGGLKLKNWRRLGLDMTWLDIAQVDLTPPSEGKNYLTLWGIGIDLAPTALNDIVYPLL